jgi:hypothetical protein
MGPMPSPSLRMTPPISACRRISGVWDASPTVAHSLNVYVVLQRVKLAAVALAAAVEHVGVDRGGAHIRAAEKWRVTQFCATGNSGATSPPANVCAHIAATRGTQANAAARPAPQVTSCPVAMLGLFAPWAYGPQITRLEAVFPTYPWGSF